MCETDKKLYEQLGRVDLRIESEYSEINNRFNWLLVSQGLFLAAFATLIDFKAGNNDMTNNIVSWLIILLPILGIWTAAVTSIAIFTGIKVIEELKPIRTSLEEEVSEAYKHKPIGTKKDSKPHSRGLLPVKHVPLLLLFVWASVIVAAGLGWQQ